MRLIPIYCAGCHEHFSSDNGLNNTTESKEVIDLESRRVHLCNVVCRHHLKSLQKAAALLVRCWSTSGLRAREELVVGGVWNSISRKKRAEGWIGCGNDS